MDQRISNLSDQQRDILKQFRSKLADILTPNYTDAVLLKYLRAKNFNLKKATTHFKEIQSTWMTYDVEKFIDTYVESEVFNYRGDTFLGYAKDGSPVRYVKGKCDFLGFLKSVPMYTLSLHFICMMERDIKAIKEGNMRTGRKNDEITYILDFDGFSLLEYTKPTVLEMSFECLRLLQDYYPERWGCVFIVNANFLLDKLFHIFKPVMKDSLIGKIKVASRDATGELLRQYIDEDVLPAFLGGKRVDSRGDIYCKEFIYQADKVPEKYYLSNCIHLIDETDPDVGMVTVGARSVFNHTLITRQKRRKYRLTMRTENGSIIFSLLYREFGQDANNPDIPKSDEYLDPHDSNCNVSLVGGKTRIPSHVAPSEGTIVLVNPGIYILQFDNTDSWFTSRKLFYRTTLLSS